MFGGYHYSYHRPTSEVVLEGLKDVGSDHMDGLLFGCSLPAGWGAVFALGTCPFHEGCLFWGGGFTTTHTPPILGLCWKNMSDKM